MKKINTFRLLLTFLILSSFSLSAQENFVSSIAPKETTYLTIQDADLAKNFLAEASSQSISVETNLVLNVSSSETWCVPTANGSEVSIAVASHSGTTKRMATVTIYAKDNKRVEIEVTQMGTEPAILLDEDKVELTNYNSTFSLGIASNVNFSFEYPEWVNAPAQTPSTGFQRYEFTAKEITEGQETGEIVIKSEGGIVPDIRIPITYTYEGYPRFAVISDIHFENNKGWTGAAKEKVPQALRNIYSKGVDALFICGDLTDYTRASDWTDFKKTFTDNGIILSTTQTVSYSDFPIYFMMGNHDFYTGTREECEKKYKDNTKQELHQYIEIKGFPFVTLSMSGTSWSSYSDEAIEFARTSLADAAKRYPGKPIFVFTHVPPKGTVYGSNTNDGNWGTDVFDSVLNLYPQVIIFSGHSHYPLADPRSIHQNKFTAINDGSTTYGEIENGTVNAGIHPEGSAKVTEAVVVTIDKNDNIEMERWDTFRNVEILPRWNVNAPHDGTAFLYKNKKNTVPPTFASNAKPVVSDVETSSCKVTFPQASETLDDVVHHYIIEIIEGTTVRSTFKKFSEYYLNTEMPQTLTVSFASIPQQKTMKARVTAVDAYNNKSTPIVSEEFTTGTYTPDPGSSKPDASTIILDVVFNADGTAKDNSSFNNTIAIGSTKPQTYLNETYNTQTAKFTGNSSAFYKVDYSGNTTIKNAFSNGFTFETLYMINSTGTNSPMSAQESGGAGFEHNSSSQLQFWVRINGAWVTITSSVTIQTGKYYHVVASYDKTNEKTYIYIDGTLAGELPAKGTFTFPSNTSAQWIAIGGDASTGSTAQAPLNGEVVVARMYDKAVSRDEVYWMYKDFAQEPEEPGEPDEIVLPTTFPQAKLVGHWAFDNAGVKEVKGGAGIGLTTTGSQVTFEEVDGIYAANVINSDVDGASANYVTFTHGLPATSGTEVKDYCLVMDIKATLTTAYLPLLWSHSYSGDADIFVKQNGSMGLSGGGLNYTGSGFIKAGWNRVVINAKLSEMKLDFHVITSDGVRQDFTKTVTETGRFSLRSDLASDIFRDNGNEDGDAHIAQVAVFNAPLTADELNAILVPWTK